MIKVPVLNRKLVLEERVLTADGAGGYDVSWSPIGTVFAAIDARRGAEREIGGRMMPSVAYTIVVRGAPHGSPKRPKPDQRLVEGARVFSILAVAERDAAGMYLELWAEEGGDDT